MDDLRCQGSYMSTAGVPSSKKRLTSQTEVLEPSVLLRCNSACDGPPETSSCGNTLGLHLPTKSACDMDSQKGLRPDEEHHHISAFSEDSSVFLSENLPAPFRIEPRGHCFTKETYDMQLQPRCASPAKSPASTAPPSLGQEMIKIVDKFRDVERECKTALQEKEQLAKQNAKQSREIERLSHTVQFLGRELKTRFQQTYPDVEIKRDQSHAVVKVCQGLKKEVTVNGGKLSVIGQSSKGQFFNPDITTYDYKVGRDNSHFENDFKGTHCSNCEKVLRREKELCMDFERRLALEKQNAELLKSRLRLLQQQLHDLQSSCDEKPSEDLNSHDRVVQDLLTEVSVLQQQMVVVVEDFEKERNDRARVVSSRNKLKENFQNLDEKVRVLKRQLMLAHSRLTEFVTRNNTLQQTVQGLQSELRVKDQKLAQALLNTGNTYNEHLQVPPVYFPMQLPVPSHWTPTQQPVTRDWSCPSCTFLNSSHRTVCEICGVINDTDRYMKPSRDFPECRRSLERNCRLVSRGLSTDEGLTELTLGDTGLPVTNTGSPESHSF
ncbi:uncharacterized protein LOC135480235 [Liolophura sinensis]|uniref:uncharacterized protein LOC135480235 n=1 Tax=Liolophura sinensis TaxID=3198878 RepID=UPI0031598B06